MVQGALLKDSLHNGLAAKLLVYSHDTFGLGNIRRMLAICAHIAGVSADTSILLVTGSPLIHSFRIPKGLDYIKLPCITRMGRESYSTKYLDLGLDVTVRLRSGLIRNIMEVYQPDVVLVDKKPLGLRNELKSALSYLRRNRPDTRMLLILRDIIDGPEPTIRTWRNRGYYDAVSRFFDHIAVLGCPDIFDTRKEYALPETLVRRTHFCGYVRKECGRRHPAEIRKELDVGEDAPLVLVTGGGGEDSSSLIETYLAALPSLKTFAPGMTSLLIYGPEMPLAAKTRAVGMTHGQSKVILREFTDDLMSYMAAADVVVSMGGYNTVCEILSSGKRAIVVPRVRPVAEQWIRAERMSRLGLFRVIHPDVLTPEILAGGITAELESASLGEKLPWVDLNALDRVADLVNSVLFDARRQHCSMPCETTVARADVAAVEVG